MLETIEDFLHGTHWIVSIAILTAVIWDQDCYIELDSDLLHFHSPHGWFFQLTTPEGKVQVIVIVSYNIVDVSSRLTHGNQYFFSRNNELFWSTDLVKVGTLYVLITILQGARYQTSLHEICLLYLSLPVKQPNNFHWILSSHA